MFAVDMFETEAELLSTCLFGDSHNVVYAVYVCVGEEGGWGGGGEELYIYLIG